jgi:hypothetical protein
VEKHWRRIGDTVEKSDIRRAENEIAGRNGRQIASGEGLEVDNTTERGIELGLGKRRNSDRR